MVQAPPKGPPKAKQLQGVPNPDGCGCTLSVTVHEVRERNHVGVQLRDEVLGVITDASGHARHLISFPGDISVGHMPACGCNRDPQSGRVSGVQPTIRRDKSGIPQPYWEARAPTGMYGVGSTYERMSATDIEAAR